MTVVSRRRSRRATTSSRTANASVDAARSCSPSPTSAAQRVARNDLRRLEPPLRPRRLARRDRPDEDHHARRRQCQRLLARYPRHRSATLRVAPAHRFSVAFPAVGTFSSRVTQELRARLLGMLSTGLGEGRSRAIRPSQCLKGVFSHAQQLQIRLPRNPCGRRAGRRRAPGRCGHGQLQTEPVQDRAQGSLAATDPDRVARDVRPPRGAGRVRGRHRRREGRALHARGAGRRAGAVRRHRHRRRGRRPVDAHG